MKRRQKRKHLENEECPETAEKGEGVLQSQEDAFQPRPTGADKGWGGGLGEISSVSEEYFSCASFPRRLIQGGFWRLHRDSPRSRSPPDQTWERGEIPSLSQHVSCSSPSSYKTCVSSPCVNKEERGMKIYYMQVQMKKGVAVSWETEETSELVEKQPRMEEMIIPEDVGAGTAPSDVSTRNLLSDSEPSGEEKEHEDRAESDRAEWDSPPASPAAEETPRARTPDCLVTMEKGFRCMACCRAFPSLEALREHVRHGSREGFSCHVFHLTMAQLTGPVESERAQAAEAEEEEEQEENEDEDEQPTGQDLGTRRPWSQCPGCVFHSSKGRK